MKPISKIIYNEMRALKLLKEEPIKDRRGKTIGCNKNYQVVNRHKSSRAKSYVVEDSVYEIYEDYLRQLNK